MQSNRQFLRNLGRRGSSIFFSAFGEPRTEILLGPHKVVENEFDSNSLELDEKKQKWLSPTENDLRGARKSA